MLKKMIVKLNLINIFSLPLYLFRICKIKNNKVFCQNFTSGKGVGDSPKYVALELLKAKDKYDIVWAVKNMDYSNVPQGIRLVKIYSLKYFYELATSKIWINNTRFPQFVRKRKKQFYIQTWHSPLRLKKIELDAKENISEYYLKCMKNDSKNIDVILSGCKFSYDIYKRAFMYNGEILKCGTPRCDVFFDKTKIKQAEKKIYDKFSIEENKKIILYAPTFRKGNSDYLINFEYISKNIKDNYVLLVKSHPSAKINVPNLKNIIDVSNYPDIQELLNSSEMLITDYSSCCFDALIANKPCILFVKDLDDYLKKERKLYFNFEDLPFEIVKTDIDLINQINKNKNSTYKDNYDVFNRKIGSYENGTASIYVKKLIEERCFCDKK